MIIKTHKFPTSDFFEFLRDNQVPFDIKFVYTYRDPRDVLISALDHHKKDPSSFKNFDSFENALILVNEHLKESLKWLDFDVHKLLFKYEVFSNDIVDTLYKLVDFLELSDDLNKHFYSIEKKYSKNSIENWNNETKKFSRLHFNKGKIGRYKDLLNSSQIETVNITS